MIQAWAIVWPCLKSKNKQLRSSNNQTKKRAKILKISSHIKKWVNIRVIRLQDKEQGLMTTQEGGMAWRNLPRVSEALWAPWPHFLASRMVWVVLSHTAWVPYYSGPGKLILTFFTTSAHFLNCSWSSWTVATSDRSSGYCPLPPLWATSYLSCCHTTEICWQSFAEGSVHHLWLAHCTLCVVMHTHNPGTRDRGRRIKSSQPASAT